MKTLSDFCFAADGNYTMPLKVCVASLIWSMRNEIRPVRVHVLDIGIGDESWLEIVESWKKLCSRIAGKSQASCVSFVRHRIERSLFDGMMPWHGSVATYARLLLPNLLSDVEWCLYSDCDVLFVESPFMLDAYCEDSEISIAGHKNPPSSDAIDGKWFRDNGLPFNSISHICAGFILMNLGYFRRHDFVQKAMDFLRKYEITASADQSALNYLCARSLRLLPKRWGIFSGEITDESGGAIHYADGVPWKLPVNATALLGHYPDIAQIWRRFAVEIAMVERKLFRFSTASLVCLRVRSAIIWSFLLVTRVFRIPAWKYSEYPGKHTSKMAVKSFYNDVFG